MRGRRSFCAWGRLWWQGDIDKQLLQRMAGDSVHWLDCSYLEALVGELSLGTKLVSVVIPEERHRRGEIGRRSVWKA